MQFWEFLFVVQCIREDVNLVPGLAQWVKDLVGVAVSCGVAHRCGLDLALLWLWHRLAAAALIPLLAWDCPYATGVALRRQ